MSVLTAVVGMTVTGAAPAVASSGVSLLPAAGQFMPLSGGAVLDTRSGVGTPNNVTGNITPDVSETFTIAGGTTAVPRDATAVVLEFNVTPNFQGYLTAGGSAQTAMRFPANAERNDFDTEVPDAAGQVTVTVHSQGTPPSNPSTSLVVRLHGYYTGAATTTAGSTYVGFTPQLLWNNNGGALGLDSTDPDSSTATYTGSTSSRPVKVTGAGLVPGDGSATAVAVEINVISANCDGEVAVVPHGSARNDRDVSFTQGDNITVFDLIQPDGQGNVDLKLWTQSPNNCGTRTHSVRITLRSRGYYSAPTYSAPGGSFTPIPTDDRVFDTSGNIGTTGCVQDSATSLNNPRDINGQLKGGHGCTITVLGVAGVPNDPTTAGIAALVLATHVPDGATGSLVLQETDTTHEAPTTTVAYDGESQISNFEMTTYSGLSADHTLYIYNIGSQPVDVTVRVHGYNKAPTTPTQPTLASSSYDGSTATISWSPPFSDGGAAITGYSISVVGGASQNVGPDVRTTNLPASSDGQATIRSTNEIGPGATATVNISDPAPKPGGDTQQAAPSGDGVFDAPATTSNPATVGGTVDAPSGAAVLNASVAIYTADTPPSDPASWSDVYLGTATTDANGHWSFTLPSYSTLSASAQGLADSNGGYLDVQAVTTATGSATSAATGQVTTYPESAAGSAAGWVGTAASSSAPINATATDNVAMAFQPQQADQSATVTTTDASRTFAALNNAGATDTAGTTFTGDATATYGQATDGNGYQTVGTSGAYSAYAATDGTDLTAATLSPDVGGGQPCGTASKTVATGHAYTVVGEYHAYWDAFGGFKYRLGADTSVGIAVSTDGLHWAADGFMNWSASSDLSMGTRKGPYQAHQVVVSMNYRKIKTTTTCASGTYVHYFIRRSGLYNPGNGWVVCKDGLDVSQWDGSSRYNWYMTNHPSYVNVVAPAFSVEVTKGTGFTYGLGASVFGVGLKVEAEHSNAGEQSYEAGNKTTFQHDIWGNTGPYTKYPQILYSY